MFIFFDSVTFKQKKNEIEKRRRKINNENHLCMNNGPKKCAGTRNALSLSVSLSHGAIATRHKLYTLVEIRLCLCAH